MSRTSSGAVTSPRARASRRKRARAASSSSWPRRSTLIATAPSGPTARWTCPLAPSPRRSKSWYEPSRMDDDALELVMTATDGAVSARARLVKRITTIGSAADADVTVPGTPPHWLTVHAEGDGATVRVLATGARHALRSGESITIDGIRVEAARARGDVDGLERVAARLAAADTPAEALRVVLDAAIAAVGADVGAILLAERGAWQVALASDAAGAP